MKILSKINCKIKDETIRYKGKIFIRSEYSSGTIIWEKNWPFLENVSKSQYVILENQYKKLKNV